MAKNQKHQDDDQLEVVGNVIEIAEGFFQKYKNHLTYGLIGLVVVIGGFFGYKEFVSKPHQREASEQMFRAEQNFALDSFRVALHGDGNTLGFKQITEEYGSTEAGNLAHFYAGVCYYNLGDYNMAIEEMGKFKANDELISARALCVIGDSYVELNQLDNAANYFTKAANYKNNDYSAMYLMKAARVYEAQGKYDFALASYQKVKKDYSKAAEAREIDKYIERADLMAKR